MVKGVTEGWTRELEINGVGYRAEVEGDTLTLALGYSHPVVFQLPEGRRRQGRRRTVITLTGADSELLGQTAAKIRELRPPEPYKGKGVKYGEEVIKQQGRQGRRQGQRRWRLHGNEDRVDVMQEKAESRERATLASASGSRAPPSVRA